MAPALAVPAGWEEEVVVMVVAEGVRSVPAMLAMAAAEGMVSEIVVAASPPQRSDGAAR